MPANNGNQILTFLILVGTFCSLVFCCGSVEQDQNSTDIKPEDVTSVSYPGQYSAPQPVPDLKTFINVQKTDYSSGEYIEISGSTPLPAGTHLLIALYQDWHGKAIPDGKATGWEEEVIVQNITQAADPNFFVSFDSTPLLPGHYYIVVSNLDAGPDDAVVLNRTSSPLTIKNDLMTTQSGIPLALTVLMIVIAFFSYRFGK